MTFPCVNPIQFDLNPFNSFQHCKNCDVKFSRRESVDLHHKYKHSGQTSNVCGECGLSCSCKANLEKHMNSVHLKIKPYICSECKFCTADERSLRKHIERHKMKRFKESQYETVDLRLKCQEGSPMSCENSTIGCHLPIS